MASSIEAEDRWDNELSHVERSMNTFFNKTTRKSPFEALHGYLPSFGNDNLANRVVEIKWNPPEEIQEEIREQIAKEQARYKGRYDIHRFKGVTYDIGEVVFMRGAKAATGESTKLQPRYKGPYTVVGILPSDTYRTHSLDECRKFETTAHVSQLKSYRNPAESEDECDSDSEEPDLDEKEAEKKEETPRMEKDIVEHESEVSDVNAEKNKRVRKVPAKLQDYVL